MIKPQRIQNPLKVVSNKRRKTSGWQIVLGIASVISVGIALASAWYAYQSLQISSRNQETIEQINLLNIEPDVQYWYEFVDGFEDLFLIKNKGPIKLKNLAVNHKSYVYDVKKSRWRMMLGGGNILDAIGENWLFLNELDVNDLIHKKTDSSSSPDMNELISGQVFDVTFYRENDMRKFEKHVIFLVYKGEVFSSKEIIKDDDVVHARNTLEQFIKRAVTDFFQEPQRGKNIKKFE